MQFIPNGPDVPDLLVDAHEAGDVVFFCGAGVSAPAGLPVFHKLVVKLYEKCGVLPSRSATAAIKTQQYDFAVDLLERNYSGCREGVRKELAALLTPNLQKKTALSTHNALLTLARGRDDHLRLVTTNFDRLFEMAGNGVSKRYVAPLLPVPKRRWDGLVYLHGVLPEDKPTATDLDRLVISSGDFGLAYLSERWAARFVTELFRNYSVCFVGYSLGDPVMRYLVDALAADIALGETANTRVYAFVNYSRGKKEDVKKEWKDKNITPILYQNHNLHTYLHKTIEAWSRGYQDGLQGKRRIILENVYKTPQACLPEDDFVGRTLWALTDRDGDVAKFFAELKPAPSLDWLAPLAEARYHAEDLVHFDVNPTGSKADKEQFSVLHRPASLRYATWMRLVGEPRGVRWLDPVLSPLAGWLAKHLNNPELLLWVAEEGGRLHPEFAERISGAFEDLGDKLSPPMRTLWGLALAGRLSIGRRRLDFYHWQSRFKQCGLTTALRFELREFLAPRVRLSRPIRAHDETLTSDNFLIRQLVDWEIVLADRDLRHSLNDLTKGSRKWREALPELLPDATSLLRDCMDLMRELEGADERIDRSSWSMPSIAEHEQNRGYRQWTLLIELTRDAWLAVAQRDLTLALEEAQRWGKYPYPVFKRLALFAATHADVVPTQQAIAWLLADDGWWLWSFETQRETFRLLASLSGRLNKDELAALQAAIAAGLPRELVSDEATADEFQAIREQSAERRLATLRGEPSNEREEFTFWIGDGRELVTKEMSPRNVRELVEWLSKPYESHSWKEDDWKERCATDFRRAAIALAHLASQGEWATQRWKTALYAWNEDKLGARSWNCLAPTLERAPLDVVRELGSALSGWLEWSAEREEKHEKYFFPLLHNVLDAHSVEPFEKRNDLIFDAINHPVGHVVGACIRRLFKRQPHDGQGLPDDVASLCSKICDRSVSIFRHGRLVLASYALTLFRIDESWAVQYLLPLFDWGSSLEEALSTWEGFLRSPRIYPPFIKRLKTAFLTAAHHCNAFDSHTSEQYALFLMYISMDSHGVLSPGELRGATHALPPNCLDQIASALVRELRSAEQRDDYWKHRILPYLKQVYPTTRDALSPSASESFAYLCIAAQNAFPEALELLKSRLRPIKYPSDIIEELQEAGLCGRYPDEVFEFLSKVIGDASQGSGQLIDCLQRIAEARPELKSTRKFVWLWDFAQRGG